MFAVLKSILDFLREIGTNLISDLIWVIITLLIIDVRLKRQEAKKWRPAKAVLSKQLLKTYFIGSEASYYVVAPFLILPKSPSPIPLERIALELLQKYSRQLERCHTALEVSNVALDAEEMSLVSEFLESADLLNGRLKFLNSMLMPQNKQVDFICDSPIPFLQKMEIVASHFRKLFPEQWYDFNVVPQNPKHIDELNNAYEKARFPASNLFLTPDSFVYREGRVPCVPDIDHLRRIPTGNVPVGLTIGVLDTTT